MWLFSLPTAARLGGQDKSPAYSWPAAFACKGGAAEQGNPVKSRNTAGTACCAVSAESFLFPRKRVIGHAPEKAENGAGVPESTSQKTYEPYFRAA